MGNGFEPDDSEPEARQGLEGASSNRAGASPADKGLADAGPFDAGPADRGLDRRFPVALGLYVVLGLLVWFTMGEGTVLVHGRPVALRLVPLVVIGGLALRTVVAHRAEKIRRQDGKASGSL